MTSADPREQLRSWMLPVAIGVLLGAAYAIVARTIDDVLPARDPGHRVLDWLFPLAFGAGIGAAVAYGRARERTARDEHRALEELQHRLQGSEREQAVWVLTSSLLHELRNPLHTVGLALEELKRLQLEPAGSDLVEQASSAAEQMKSRFQRLRQLAGEPSQRSESYDLSELIRGVAVRFDALARTCGARVEADVPASLCALGDQQMTRTALENLVSNAVDAVRVGHGSRVSIEAHQAADGTVVTVRDDGPGVPPSMQAEIFQPLRSSKGPTGGLGLGLPIARALARAQGGELELSDDHAGTTFALTLPEGKVSS